MLPGRTEDESRKHSSLIWLRNSAWKSSTREDLRLWLILLKKKTKKKTCHIRVREEEERLHMSNSSRLQARSPAGPTLLALKWRPDEVSVILGAHRLQVEASLPRRLSVWALWMMKAAKMLSHLSVTSLGAKRNPLSLRKERERNCN